MTNRYLWAIIMRYTYQIYRLPEATDGKPVSQTTSQLTALPRPFNREILRTFGARHSLYLVRFASFRIKSWLRACKSKPLSQLKSISYSVVKSVAITFGQSDTPQRLTPCTTLQRSLKSGCFSEELFLSAGNHQAIGLHVRRIYLVGFKPYRRSDMAYNKSTPTEF